MLQWVTRLKCLGVWFLACKSFSLNHCVNRTKFLSAVFGILRKCGNISEEILWNVIQCSCLPILLYGIDSVHLNAAQVQKLSVACNTAVRRCVNISHFTSVRNFLYFLGTLPVKLLLEESKLMLVKSCTCILSWSIRVVRVIE